MTGLPIVVWNSDAQRECQGTAPTARVKVSLGEAHTVCDSTHCLILARNNVESAMVDDVHSLKGPVNTV